MSPQAAADMVGYDLDGIDGGGEASGFEDGWYEGFFLHTRSFKRKDGTALTFSSGDTPSKDGASRNIRLEVEVTRKTDGRTMNVCEIISVLSMPSSRTWLEKLTPPFTWMAVPSGRSSSGRLPVLMLPDWA